MVLKPTCFIAMAFNHDDTDNLYDHQIKPILKRNNVKDVIINRRQSNQDLNIQIIEQLEKCHFCIADLTYARPSVYYEAGFAERYVPVIYTVRRDHLSRNQPDDLRVHFDLLMKNLITWKNPEDTKFSKELENRIRTTFLRSWERKIKDYQNEQNSVDRFNSLTMNGRLQILRKRTINSLRPLGFKVWQTSDLPKMNYSFENFSSGMVNNMYSSKIVNDSMHIISIHAFPSATKNLLRRLKPPYSLSLALFHEIDRDQWKAINKIYTDFLILSIRSVPSSRIEDVFTSHSPIIKGLLYESKFINTDSKSKPAMLSHSRFDRWHFISGIKTVKQFSDRLDKVINKDVYK